MGENSRYDDFHALKQILDSMLLSRALVLSFELSVFSLLSKPISIADASKRLDVDLGKLEALFELLESAKLLKRNGELWANSPLINSLLESSSDTYQGNTFQYVAQKNLIVFDNMLELLTGKGDGKRLLGNAQPVLQEYLPFIPAERSSLGITSSTVDFITSLPEIQMAKSLCDVGGGSGHLSKALVDRIPSLEVDLLELESNVETIESELKDTNYGSRISVIPHDITSDGPPEKEYSLILLSDVVYLFQNKFEETLSKYSTALEPKGWIVLRLPVKEPNVPHTSKMIVEFSNRILGFPKPDYDFLQPEQIHASLENLNLTVHNSKMIGDGEQTLIIAARSLG